MRGAVSSVRRGCFECETLFSRVTRLVRGERVRKIRMRDCVARQLAGQQARAGPTFWDRLSARVRRLRPSAAADRAVRVGVVVATAARGRRARAVAGARAASGLAHATIARGRRPLIDRSAIAGCVAGHADRCQALGLCRLCIGANGTGRAHGVPDAGALPGVLAALRGLRTRTIAAVVARVVMGAGLVAAARAGALTLVRGDTATVANLYAVVAVFAFDALSVVAQARDARGVLAAATIEGYPGGAHAAVAIVAARAIDV